MTPRSSIVEPSAAVFKFRGLRRFICSLPGSTFAFFWIFPDNGPQKPKKLEIVKEEARRKANQRTACNEPPGFKKAVGGVAPLGVLINYRKCRLFFMS